mgnify:CR=1 FL=1
MSLIKEEFIAELLSRVDIVEIFSRDHKVSKRGANYICLSPFKDEKTPSCIISSSKQMFYDKSADISGNIFTYLMKKYNFSYPEAVKDLAKFCTMDVQYEDQATAIKYEEKQKKIHELKPILKSVQRKFVQQLKELPKNHEAWSEIKKRGYSNEQVEHWELGYAPGGKFIYNLLKENGLVELGRELNLINEKNNDKIWNRLTYPIYDERGEILGFSSRSLNTEDQTKWMNPANTEIYNKSNQLYGLNFALQSISKSNTVWLVEGYNDVIAWQENGIINTVSPYGKELAEGQINKLKRFAEKAIVCFDGDKAGIDAILRNVPKLFAKGFNVEVCILPDNLDPDDFIREYKITPEQKLNNFLREKGLIENGFSFLMEKWIIGETTIEKAEGVKKCARVLSTIEDKTHREIYQEMLQKASKLSKTTLKEIIKDLDSIKIERKNINLSEYDLPTKLQDVDISKYQSQIREYSFFQHENEIWALVERNEELDTFKSISNFEIEIIQHMNDDKFPKKLFRIKNKRGVERIFDAPANSMQNTGVFTTVLENQGNYRFKGRTNHLDNLKDYLFDSMGTGRAVDVLGWNPEGFFVWNNQITIPGTGTVKMDDNGVFHYNDVTYYVPSANGIYKNNPTRYISQKRFIVKSSNFTLEDYLSQLRKVHRDHAITGILFLLAAAFHDIVKSEISAFPLLFLFGPGSSGKDQLSQGLRSFFGDIQSVISLSSKKSTGKAQIREFAQFANVITHLSEYRNGDLETNEMLKGLWDLNGYKFGTLDSRVSSDEVPILSAPLVTSNDCPTEEPLIIRMLWEEMVVNSFDEQAKQNFNKLDDMIKEGVSHFMVDILLKRHLVEEHFTRQFRNYKSSLTKRNAFKGLPERIATNHAVIAAMYEIFHNDIHFPFTRDEMLSHFDVMVTAQRRRIENESVIQKFWQLFIICLRTSTPSYLKNGVDFKVDGKTIYFNFSFVYGRVQQDWYRTFNSSAPTKTELRKALCEDDAFIGSSKSVRFSADVNTSALIFDTSKLAEEDVSDINYSIDIQERNKNSDSPVTPSLFDNKKESFANSDTTNKEVEDDLPF